MTDIIALEKERLAWSRETFTRATPQSSLEKLKKEIGEVEELIPKVEAGESKRDITVEYADCLMCLFDSAGRLNITPDQIFAAFEVKLEQNKLREWVENPDHSYSHKKV